MKIAIRALTAEDVGGLASLFQEMQANYGVGCPPRERIVEDLGGVPPGTTVFVARDEAAVLGFAACASIYPGPGLRRGLFLKELFVSSRARGAGLGTRLLREVARFALDQGCARVDWTAERGNRRLLDFYTATGAAEHPDKVFFRLSGEALQRFGSEDS